jgi:hypothetical protein
VAIDSEHALSDGRDRGDGTQGVGRDVVTTSSPRFLHEPLGSELPQVVGGLAGAAAVKALSAGVLGLARELGDREALGGNRQCRDCRQGAACAPGVEADPPDPGGPEHAGARQLVQEAVGDEAVGDEAVVDEADVDEADVDEADVDEADAGAVERGAKALGHLAQALHYFEVFTFGHKLGISCLKMSLVTG